MKLNTAYRLLLLPTAYCSCLLLLFPACQPTLIAEFQDRPVVTGYLYAGEPVRVTVSKLLPFRDDVSFADEDVDNLALTVTDETTGHVYALTAQGDSGIYTGGSAFVPEAGHTYQLHFVYDDVPVTAVTQIAAPPEQVAFSKTTVSAGFGGGGGGGIGGDGGMMEPVEITWDNPAGDYYIVTGVCITPNPTPVFDMDDDEEDAAPDLPLSFQTEPTQGASVQLSSQSFSYYGKYTVKLCRIQPEYVLLYQREQSRSTLPELHANVENGFGLFTGVSSVNVEMTVVSR